MRYCPTRLLSQIKHTAFAAGAALTIASTASATVPYGSLAGGLPGVGPGLAPPSIVPGKEYSHNLDHTITAVGTAPFFEQVVAWDGSGGVANGVNFVGERASYLTRSEVDAIANRGDYLFNQLKSERAHLVWSFDDTYHSILPGGGVAPGVLPPTGPVSLANGNTVGGAAELNYELGLWGGANAPETQGVWAKAAEINAMPTAGEFVDIDGVELWGPEPAFTADSDKYSLDIDMLTTGAGPGGGAVSVWNGGSGTPYASHATIAAAVVSLLGPVSGYLPSVNGAIDGIDAINLDALMVREVAGEMDDFGRDPTGGGNHDEIIFSIRQILDPSSSTGYYATGSELFVLDGAGSVSFLKHGGHAWDKAYALTTFGTQTPNGRFVLDVNAIEAVGQSVVPEPAAAALGFATLATAGAVRRRRREG